MHNFIPDIQERFRKSGFPEYRTRQLPKDIVWSGTEFLQNTTSQWEFADKDNTTSILLNIDAVTIQTTAYKKFEDLHSTIKLAFTIIHEIVGLAQAHRYGLRYVNVVRFVNNPTIAEWITPSLLGMPHLDTALRAGSFCETILHSTDDSRLVARCMAMPGGLPIPVDLLPCTLSLPFAIPLDEAFVILDNDHSKTFSEDFDPEKATLAVGNMHDLLDRAFRAAVTTYAIEQWK
jgi:uncharacterized protein (TIGR04255 family)